MKLSELFSKYNISLTSSQEDMFLKYFEFLVEENQKYNLTAITEKEEVFLKHFLDSALPISIFKNNASVIDVGSGAGFPAVPLKILKDSLSVTMVDSLNKRVNFLNCLCALLDLKNISAIHARAEEFIKNNREQFDYAVARAVAPLNTLLEYLVPYLKVGGRCVIYKSQKLDEELKNAENAIKVLNVKIEKILTYQIGDAERKILVMQKFASTNAKYPRGKNLPKLKPL